MHSGAIWTVGNDAGRRRPGAIQPYMTGYDRGRLEATGQISKHLATP